MLRARVIIIFCVGIIVSVLFFNNCGKFSGDPANPLWDTEVNSSAVAREFKVAFLGDTGIGEDFEDTLNLIVGEGVDAIMINGDFSYEEPGQKDPSRSIMRVWRDQLLGIVDVNKIAVFGALGNHDIDDKDQDFLNGQVLPVFIEYFRRFRSGNPKMVAGCTGGNQIRPDKDIILLNETCTFGNVTLVASGHGITETPQLSRQFLEQELDKKFNDAPTDNWKVAGYHFTLASMNAAGKPSESKHSFFDIIRQHGAIGVQAHTHSAMASCPISSEFKEGNRVRCAPGSDYNNRKIQDGTGLYLDSSAGGYEVRRFEPCNNANTSDCGHLYDYISSTGYHRNGNRNASKSAGSGFGAIFVVFNDGGDTSKANVYYKNVEGETVFNFNIRRDISGSSPGGQLPSDGQQYNGVFGGRVLHRVSANLACKPEVLKGVLTDAGKYAALESDYDRDRCANGGLSVSPLATPSAQQYRASAQGRVLQRVSPNLACKPEILRGVLTDGGKYAELERDYDPDRCASR